MEGMRSALRGTSEQDASSSSRRVSTSSRTRRLDSPFSSRGSSLGVAWSRRVGSRSAEDDAHSPSFPDRVCPSCGAATCWFGSLCEHCSSDLGPPPSPVCGACSRPVSHDHPMSRVCVACRKYIHAECDPEMSTMAQMDGEYLCSACRRSPLVADTMMSNVAGGSSSLAASPAASSSAVVGGDDELSGAGAVLDSVFVSTPSGRSSPLGVGVLDSFSEIFQLPTGSAPASSQQADEMSATTGTTNSAHSSARQSPCHTEDFDSIRLSMDRDPQSLAVRRRPGKGKGLSRQSSMKTRSSVAGSEKGDHGDARVGEPARAVRGKSRGNKTASRVYSARGRRSKNSTISTSAMSRDFDQDSTDTEESRQKSDENDYIRTVIVTSSDEYLCQMPLCLICGSIGKDVEGTMVSCSSCAQSYHTYCVNLHEKLNKTILKRGWRCLDCTVCEGCGDGKDESNLLLCDECDVAYHIYCLDPPLERIPHGPWRCSWCATCRRCGVRVAATGSSSIDGAPQRTQLLCDTCASLRKCGKCLKTYELGDAIVKCHHCLRWYHGKCEELYGEEMLESACEQSFRCSFCRPSTTHFHTSASFPSVSGDMLNQLICDNVAVNKSAYDVVQWRIAPLATSRNQPSHDTTHDVIHAMHASRTQSLDEYTVDDAASFDEIELGAGSIAGGHSASIGGSSTRGSARGGRGGGAGGGGPGRKMQKLGIGGFFVRPAKTAKSNAIDEECGEGDETGKCKMKRPRKPRRSQLEDSYPPQIQEGFFGVTAVEGRHLVDVPVDEPQLQEFGHGALLMSDASRLTGAELSETSAEIIRHEQEDSLMMGDITDGLFGDNLDTLDINFDNFDLDLMMDDDDDEDTSLTDALALTQSDDAFIGKEYGENRVGGYGTVGGVCNLGGGSSMHLARSSSFPDPRHALQAGTFQPQLHAFARSASQTSGGSGSTAGHLEVRINQATERWEEDEPLGERATKAAVLFANVNFPDLRVKYPLWHERVKQIHRMWRGLDAAKRQDYVTRARENRTSSRAKPKKRCASQGGRSSSAAGDSPKSSPSPGAAHQIHQRPQPGMPSGQPPFPPYQNPHETMCSSFDEQRFKVPSVPYGQATPQMVVAPQIVPQPVRQQFYLQQQQPPVDGQHVDMSGRAVPLGDGVGVPIGARAVPTGQRGMPQQTTAHLPENLRKQYELLHMRTLDLQKLHQAIEGELSRMRKQKKNLAAKRRQLNKNSATGDVTGQALAIDLNDQDKGQLAQLMQMIPMRAKDLDNCKRDIRTHQTNLQDFEIKNGIPPSGEPPLEGDGQETPPSPSVDPNVAMRPLQSHQMPATSALPPGPSPTMALHVTRPGVPPQAAYPLAGASGMIRVPSGALVSHTLHHVPSSPAYPQAYMSPRGMMEMPGHVPTQAGMPRRTMQIASGEAVGAKAKGKKRRKQESNDVDSEEALAVHRNRSSQSLESQVIDLMQEIVSQVVIMVDGVEAARESGMLKRLLQSEPSRGAMPVRGAFGGPANLFNAYQQEERLYPPTGELEAPAPATTMKTKKKRTQTKKPASSGLDEYSLLVDRITTQLQLCQALPKCALEPMPRNDRHAFSSVTLFALSDLPDRVDKPSMIAREFGQLDLVFMDDFYSSMMNATHVDETSLCAPSMHFIANTANLTDLQRQTLAPSMCLVHDELDSQDTVSDLAGVCAVDGVRCSSPPLRLACRLPDPPQPPTPPHRCAFTKTRTTRREHLPCATMLQGMSSYKEVEDAMQRLKSLLALSEHIDFTLQIETPPSTPDLHQDGRRSSSGEASLEESRSRQCRHCERTMRDTEIVQQTLSHLGLTPSDDGEQTVSFCSQHCYYHFIATCKIALSPDELSNAERHVDEQTLTRLHDISAESFATRCVAGRVKSEETRIAPIAIDLKMNTNVETNEMNVNVANVYGTTKEAPCHVRNLAAAVSTHSPSGRQLPGGIAGSTVKTERRWRGEWWTVCDAELLDSFHRLQEAVRQKYAAIQLQHAERAARGVGGLARKPSEDLRSCALCALKGDGDVEACGRLLNVDADVWVHVNCALWSQEVYETQSGALMQVELVLRRARSVICSVCGLKGASLRCYKLTCTNQFHLRCAQTAGCRFLKDKTLFCADHCGEMKSDVHLSRLEVLRRVYIDRDENALIAKIFQSDSTRLLMRVGSLVFHHIGQLLPEQLKAFHSSEHIFPIGFHVTRIFWSPLAIGEKMRFECTIRDCAGAPQFHIAYDGREIREKSASDAWIRILTAVQQLRERSPDPVLQLFPKQLSGELLFGLTEPAISKMTESVSLPSWIPRMCQVPGVENLITYSFKHGGSPLMDLPLAVNPSGCARCEPRFRTYIKHRSHGTVHSSGVVPASTNSLNPADLPSSSSRPRGNGGNGWGNADAATVKAMLQASGISADMIGAAYLRVEAGQSTTSYYSQYQRMRKEWRNTVYLARSKIQGLGLYAKRDIDMNAMIIEYKGDIIRNEVSERREKRYNAQNRGVYMFRIDDERVIDATMAGGPARYINHSCDPNCSTRILSTGANGDDKKIIIIANRPISQGEELTYDYQFDIEDGQNKLPCLCGAPNCQKWMN